MNLFLIFLLSCSSVYGQSPDKIEYPAIDSSEKVIEHTAFSLVFDTVYHQAKWVAYLLTKDETIKAVERSDKFKADPLIPETDLSKDYAKSGYDRGHLAPAADMGFSKITMLESFYYSNMSPQVPAFNRGIWKQLETQVRDWATANDSICVVTGPIFSDSMKTIGPHLVAVPYAYYKVLLDCHKGKERGIGFIIPNAGSSEKLSFFMVAIDEAELLTGLDFFPALEDKVEERIEEEVVWW